MDQTSRFGLLYLAPGQVGKEAVVNEGFQRIDLLIGAAVEGLPQSDPPSDAALGQCFLVAAGATGAWEGRDGTIAGLTAGGWRFVEPVEGMRLLDKPTGQSMLRRNGAWETGVVRASELTIGGKTVVSERQPAIAEPADGASPDTEARAAISAVLGALRAHGLIES